jgi:antirestriction protein ArdC
MRPVFIGNRAPGNLEMKAMRARSLSPNWGLRFYAADLALTPEPGTDHAAYIQSWLKVLKEDKRAIFSAAAHAQKAVDFLHGLQARCT